MTKSKQTGLKMYNKHSTNVEYEYKGYKYDVEYSNDMSYYITKPHIQHRIEQERIDKIIKDRSMQKGKYTGECEKALEELWEEMGW